MQPKREEDQGSSVECMHDTAEIACGEERSDE